MVDGVLEHAGNGAVVFGRDEHHGIHRAQLALQPLHFRGLAAIFILVVQRQVADPQFLEVEIRRTEPDERIGKLAVVGILAKAANHVTDLPGHAPLLVRP